MKKHSILNFQMGHFKGKRKNKNPPQQRKSVEYGYVPPAFIDYYRHQFVPEVLSEDEFNEMVEYFRKPLCHTFRLIESPHSEHLKKELESFSSDLIAKNITLEKVDFLSEIFGTIYRLSADKPTLRREPALKDFRDWLNLHMRLGNLVRQELVSMVPPYFLDLHNDHRVLDVAAAPGSKTSQILNFVTNGLLVANDVSVTRCTTLVHNINRLETAQAIVTSYPAQYIPIDAFGASSFDRILCDVPCSGDGTLRKNPDASVKFNLENGASLHSIQRAILIRALKLLKKGGRIVYSTCSLNPIEDEAVINSVVKASNGTVKILDVSAEFPNMKRSKGMKSWKVLCEQKEPTMYPGWRFIPNQNNINKEDNSSNDDSNTENENPGEKHGNNRNKKSSNKGNTKKEINESEFDDTVVEGIENCMRFFPHQNDTGGFFITVLQKIDEYDIEEPKLPHKPIFNWREHPFIPLMNVSPETAEHLKESFGLDQEFIDNCFVRDEKMIRNIFYCSNNAASLVKTVDPNILRAVACGTRVFTWKEFSDSRAVKAVPCIEGSSMLIPFIKKRKVEISDNDMKLLIRAGNDGLPFNTLQVGSEIADNSIGSMFFHIPGTRIAYGGLRMKDKVIMYVKKDVMETEVGRIECECSAAKNKKEAE
ncbi:NOL1/NOP2/sun family protein [Tritrichomonas foetus]|uniref:NOL1/NOP2/sun family protein n=1 Tax=Tritrichomonas foetus TaxID=1144522 RepID=A0A1J4JFM2_9EUKA|nr:NOL1/NOP2/sun family protein [Tritrichomonas foetus]|eukprot:OHS97946.1 NOL1/NOP2/sun family protein [Tritrichomonas foetus]